MGKSKSRIFRRGANESIPRYSRQDALKDTIKSLEEHDIKKVTNIITMFGLNAEELLEAGASYEAITAIKDIFKSWNF
ncbi:hypothetical protein IJ579_07395 [bacterium]|nr:hypothetical protein [bacterium]